MLHPSGFYMVGDATNTVGVYLPGDYDGDGLSDFAVYRPATSEWYVLFSSTGNTQYLAMTWGQVGMDVPVPGDYDGDGKTDLGLYRAATGTWWVRLSGSNCSTYVSQAWGLNTDTPINGRQ